MPNDVRLIRAPISIVGMVLTTISAVAVSGRLSRRPVRLAHQSVHRHRLLPDPAGALPARPGADSVRRVGRAAAPRAAAVRRPSWPRIDLNDPTQRHTAVIIFALTMANVVIVSLAAYRGVEYMDSPQFCGQVCHTVMKPEFAAYQDGPHSRVSCVQCHVGPGRVRRSPRAKIVRHAAAARGDVPHLLAADSIAGAQPAPGDAKRASSATGRRSFTATRSAVSPSTPTTRRTPRSVTTLQVHVGGGSERLRHCARHPLAHERRATRSSTSRPTTSAR